MIVEISEVELKSNAANYLVFRSKRLGASEIPALMGLSPYQTPYGLWKLKTGRTKNEFFTNFAIELGKKFEDTARARFEMKVDADYPPTIVVADKYPWMHASLDGLNKDTNTVLEIKCVSGDKVMIDAQEGVVAAHYRDQVQQQMYCAGSDMAHFYVCKIESTSGVPRIVADAIVIEKADPERQQEIVKKTVEFWSLVQSDTPPPMGERDSLDLTDDESVELFSKIKALKLKGESIDSAKAKAIVLADKWHTNVKCCGLWLKKTNGKWILRSTEKES